MRQAGTRDPFRWHVWCQASSAETALCCTEVADFGVYWDRGTLDPALAGRWKKIGLPGEPISSTPGPDLVMFTNAGTSYSLRMTNPVDPALAPDEMQRMKDNDARFAAKTLRIGGRNFLMVRPDDGSERGAIKRYEIKGDVLEEWWLLAAAKERLDAKHLNVQGMKPTMGSFVTIEKLDDEVVGILAETLNDRSLWILSCQYRKTLQ